LTPGHQYTWYVAAYNTNSQGATGNAGQTFVLGLAPPTLRGPNGAITASAGYDTPTYSWNPVTGAEHYYLFVVDQITGRIPVVNSNITGTSWKPGIALTPGDHFTWYLGAYTADGQDAHSAWNGQAFFLAAYAPPTPAAVPGGNPPTFSWSSVAGAGHYYVFVTDLITSQIPVFDPTVTGTSLTPSAPLTRGHRYVWYVGAYSTDGLSSAWSKGQIFQIP
jgi:hypothetical protein